MKKLLLAAAIAASSAGASAEWSPVQISDSNSPYTSTESTNAAYTNLVLYADPNDGCSITMRYMEIDYSTDADEQVLDVELQMKVKSIVPFIGATINIKHQRADDGSYFTVFDSYLTPSETLISEIVTGDKLILRIKIGDKWFDTVRFSLAGSRHRINQMLSKCSDMQGSEWEETSYSSDEWSV